MKFFPEKGQISPEKVNRENFLKWKGNLKIGNASLAWGMDDSAQVHIQNLSGCRLLPHEFKNGK